MTNEQIETLISSGTREGNGVWVNIGTKGAKMYIPDNVAPGESGLIYFNDSAPSYNSYGMQDAILKDGCNKIAIFLGCGDYNEEYLDLIDSVASYKGVGAHVNHSMGASAGATNGLHMQIASIKKNNEKNQTAVLLECAYNGKNDGYLNITEDDITTLKNSNSSLLFIEEWYRENDQNYNLESASYLKDVATSGVPVVVAHYKDLSKGHMDVVDEFTRNSNILDYLDGKSSLTGIDNFTFSYCDNNGSWQHNKSFTEITAILGKSAKETVKSLGISQEEIITPNADFSSLKNNFESLKKLMYDKFGNLYSNLVKSDENYAEYSAGQLLTTIANTTFLDGINNSNYQSTTSIPKEEDYVINKYFTITGSLLEKISEELQNIITISDAIKETDKKLENVVNDNNSIEEPTETPSLPSSPIPSITPSNSTDFKEPTPSSTTGTPSASTNDTETVSKKTTSSTDNISKSSTSNIGNTDKKTSHNQDYNQNTKEGIKNNSNSTVTSPKNNSPSKEPMNNTGNIAQEPTKPTDNVESTNNNQEYLQEEVKDNSNNLTPPSNNNSTSVSTTPKEETNNNSASSSSGYIPKDPNIKTPTNSSNNNQPENSPSSNVTSKTKKEDSSINPLGVVLGAVAMGGAGYAGKKIYDKAKQLREDEEE